MAGWKAVLVTALLGWPLGQALAEEASDADLLKSGAGMIEARHKDCDVGIQNFGRISDEATNDAYQVWIYQREACNGGINWNAGIEIFKIANERLIRVPTPDLGWSTVKGADFNAQRTVVYAVSWGPKDGHCCPTVGQSLAFSVRDGTLVMRQLRSWTERSP